MAPYTSGTLYDSVPIIAAPPTILNENIFHFKNGKLPVQQGTHTDSITGGSNTIEVIANVKQIPDKFLKVSKKSKPTKWSSRKKKTEDDHCDQELELIRSEDLTETSTAPFGFGDEEESNVQLVTTTESILQSTMDATTSKRSTTVAGLIEYSTVQSSVEEQGAITTILPSSSETENLVTVNRWPYESYNHNPLINFIHLTTSAKPWKGQNELGSAFKPSKPDIAFDFVPKSPFWR